MKVIENSNLVAVNKSIFDYLHGHYYMCYLWFLLCHSGKIE